MDSKFISAAVGLFGAFITYGFGGWSGLLEVFLLALAIDYITGVAASVKEGKGLSSEIGLWGLLKKALMVIAVLFAYRVDVAFGTDYVMAGMIYALLVNEIISLAENYSRLGLPLGDHLKPILSIFKNKGEAK